MANTPTPAQNSSAAQKVRLSGGVPVVSSMIIAAALGRKHNDLMRSIRFGFGRSDGLMRRGFLPNTYYVSGNGRNYPFFDVTRDGFLLLAGRLHGNGIDCSSVVESFLNLYDIAARKAPVPKSEAPAVFPEAVQALAGGE